MHKTRKEILEHQNKNISKNWIFIYFFTTVIKSNKIMIWCHTNKFLLHKPKVDIFNMKTQKKGRRKEISHKILGIISFSNRIKYSHYNQRVLLWQYGNPKMSSSIIYLYIFSQVCPQFNPCPHSSVWVFHPRPEKFRLHIFNYPNTEVWKTLPSNCPSLQRICAIVCNFKCPYNFTFLRLTALQMKATTEGICHSF